MIAEINVFGVLVSSVLASALIAWAVLVPVRRLLAWSGFYQWTWHRHLVDAALFVLLWGATTAALPAVLRLLQSE
jgi:hypothetical protein